MRRIQKVVRFFFFYWLKNPELAIRQRRTRFFSCNTLWARITKNTDWSTRPLARPFTCSLATLTRLLAPHYLLRSHAPLRSLARLLAYIAHSLARGKVNDWMTIYSMFFSILAHCAKENTFFFLQLDLILYSFRQELIL